MVVLFHLIYMCVLHGECMENPVSVDVHASVCMHVEARVDLQVSSCVAVIFLALRLGGICSQ